MELIDNLKKINNCKNAINAALANKGVEMSDVTFEGYAEIIESELQLKSGDTPSTPTPSADYVYSNGYLTSGDVTNEIINFVPYEIVLDGEGKCVFDFTCPVEYPIYESLYISNICLSNDKKGIINIRLSVYFIILSPLKLSILYYIIFIKKTQVIYNI